MMNKFITENKTALIIATLAVIIRLIYLLELSGKPGFTVPMVDEKFHWLWAQDILHNSFWGENAYFRAPLYGYFLAFLYFVTNGSIFWSKLLQLLLCGGTAFFIYKTAEHLFNRKTALTAGIIYTLYGTLFFYEAMFLIPVVFLFFVTWGVYRLIVYQKNLKITIWLFTGFLFGAAAIARPNILLVIPFFMLWMFFTIENKAVLFQRIKLPLILLAGLLIAVLPVTVRNAVVTGEFILISSQGGINLYLGNNQIADGLTMLMPEVDLDESISWEEFNEVTRKAAEREAFKKLTEAEASAFWSKKAVDFIVEHPGTFLSLLYKKSVYLLSGFENSDNTDIYYSRNKSIVLSVLLWEKFIYFPFGILLPLTLVGIYTQRKKFKQLLPVYIYLLAYIPSIILFLVTARHRLPLIPFMIILASAGLVYLWQNYDRLEFREKVIAMLVLLFSVVIFNQIYFDEAHGSAFQIHYNNGIQFEKLGELEKAEQEYLLADADFGFSAPLINNLGFVQYQLNKNNEAKINFERAIRLKPSYIAALNNYGLLLHRLGDYDSALVLYRSAITNYNPDNAKPEQLSQVHANLGKLFEDTRFIDSAAAYYFQAVKADTLNWKAYTRAAAFYARHGQYRMTDTLYYQASKIHQLSAADLFNWGLSQIERKQYSLGLSMLHKSLAADSTLYQGYYVIAAGYMENNYPDDSVLWYLDQTFRYNPNYQPAIDLRKIVEKR